VVCCSGSFFAGVSVRARKFENITMRESKLNFDIRMPNSIYATWAHEKQRKTLRVASGFDKSGNVAS
jgi:hypothetical protein